MHDTAALASAAIERVRRWLAAAPKHRDPSAEQLASLLQDHDGLQFAIDFVDKVVRPEDPAASARAFHVIGARPPRFLSPHLRLGVLAGATFARPLPRIVVPAAKAALRHMVSHLVIDARAERLGTHLARLTERGVKVNVNLLGEAVLGREAANRRLQGTLELLRRDDVEYVSIKVSSVVAQLNMWAFDETVDEVVERLLPLYEEAARTGKFINLDMEEYRDLDLTIAVFQRMLSRPEFLSLEAGIVLQTYLPDTLGALERLTAFARDRIAQGGAGIKVRIVKGANLVMERVDAAIHGWPLAVVGSKAAADANYKRVLHYALQPQHAAAVRIGVAGHNLFDLAYAIELAQAQDTLSAIDGEMLLGMAEDHLDAIRADVDRVVLYTPVVHPKDFDAAVAYLVRRLEENGSSENFISGVFELDDPAIFGRERERFLHSLDLMAAEDAEAAPRPNRRQDRRSDTPTAPDVFVNEPDTDPSLAGNRQWGRDALTRSAAQPSAELVGEAPDPDAPIDEQVRFVEQLIGETIEAGRSWAARSARERRDVLYAAAQSLGMHRGDLIEVMARETGKTLSEGDIEVSEAIDFCRYYADRAVELDEIEGATPVPVPLTVVVPPWNFPTAIPCGGVVAALATGSPVIIKPAPQAMRTARVLVEALWAGGVPESVLRFAPLPENEAAKALITDERVGRLILTGSSETAALFQQWRPELVLLGETSGKNGIIITPDADLDLAAADLARSAFFHAGQKCSAASLGILVGSVATSQRFLRQLVDAVTTYQVGYPQDPRVHIGPVIEPAAGKLLRALTELEEGEEWLLQPRPLDDSGRLWSPGIRTGVRPGSYTHTTEFFGPHLSLIAVRDLDEAIAVQNGTAYGLTAGIHSLDAEQVHAWTQRVEAGNLYINRGITGAIVRRQPFGGWKLSQVGPGAKAGGPNYLTTLVDWRPDEHTPGAAWLEQARESDVRAAQEFGAGSDPSQLGVERNVLRYRPSDEVLVRLADDGDRWHLERVLQAARFADAKVRVSSAVPLRSAEVTVEDDATFHQRLAAALAATQELPRVRRIRLIGSDPELYRLTADQPEVAIFAAPVTVSGRLEQLPFLREQAVSVTAHRHGNPDPRFEALPL